MQLRIDLYATPVELTSWLGYMNRRLPLHFGLVQWFPEFAVTPLESWPAGAGELDPQVREIWIGLAPIDSSCSHQLECAARNVDRLSVQLPSPYLNGLRTGGVGTVTESSLHLEAWRAIVRYIKSQTVGGMWVQNPNTGAKAYAKHLRFSTGIAALCQQGLELFPLAGTNQVTIHEPGSSFLGNP